MATFQMTLEDFLEGEFELEETFIHSLVEGDSEEKVVESESSSKKVRIPLIMLYVSNVGNEFITCNFD